MGPVETQEHYHPSCHPRAGSHLALTKLVTRLWETELGTTATLVTSVCVGKPESPSSVTGPAGQSGRKLSLPPSCFPLAFALCPDL